MTNNSIQQIKDQLNIVEVIGEHIELRPSGDRYLGFCPFHNNINTPSFTIYPDQGRWICYGCGKKGDVLTFLEDIEGTSFRDILQKYAKILNIPLRKITKDTKAYMEHQEELYAILSFTAQYFNECLTWHEHGRQARSYLADRNISATTIAQFNLGFARDHWTDLVGKVLPNHGYEEKLIIEAGLGKKKKTSSGLYNFFRNRLIFPIGINGAILGFGGRTLVNDPAKYLNSPSSSIFSKRSILYGLPQAREGIRETGEAVIVEGYMDVLALHQSGFTNAVSIMGTTLTREHGKTLRNLTNRVVLAFDADAAGKKAIMRLKIEEQNGIDLYIAELPKEDPDEIVLADPSQWARLVEGAIAIPVYVTDTLVAAAKNLDDPKEKSMIVNRVLRLLDYVSDPHEQAAYQEYLAKAVGYESYRPNTTCPHCGKKYHD
jgi:DNA primase